MAAVRLVISGRVQGVGFRAYVERQARRRALRGWVRNRRDGTVETLLIGEEALLREMEAFCHRGPAFAAVSRVERYAAEDEGIANFEQRPTE